MPGGSKGFLDRADYALISQKEPTQLGGQEQMLGPTHVPPLRQKGMQVGAVGVWQVGPEKPFAHAQVKSLTPSMQVPPFRHGLGVHAPPASASLESPASLELPVSVESLASLELPASLKLPASLELPASPESPSTPLASTLQPINTSSATAHPRSPVLRIRSFSHPQPNGLELLKK